MSSFYLRSIEWSRKSETDEIFFFFLEINETEDLNSSLLNEILAHLMTFQIWEHVEGRFVSKHELCGKYFSIDDLGLENFWLDP